MDDMAPVQAPSLAPVLQPADPPRQRKAAFTGGLRIAEVVEVDTSQIIPMQIFVAVLGASSFTYAETVWDQ
jgi:transposase